jgi:hypothetical protein
LQAGLSGLDEIDDRHAEGIEELSPKDWIVPRSADFDQNDAFGFAGRRRRAR